LQINRPNTKYLKKYIEIIKRKIIKYVKSNTLLSRRAFGTEPDNEFKLAYLDDAVLPSLFHWH